MTSKIEAGLPEDREREFQEAKIARNIEFAGEEFKCKLVKQVH